MMIRLFDVFFSAIGLIILAPVIFIIILLGLIDTGSPFFYQKRVGIYKNFFLLIKFRTMRLKTKQVETHLVDKTLITTLGKFLRITKLDEIPQLFNVIKGDMSLVGPRPCLLNQKKLIKERHTRGVYNVLPGITGLAQLKKIDMSTPTLLAKTDLKMIKKMNIVNYFNYIFLTIFSILRLKFL